MPLEEGLGSCTASNNLGPLKAAVTSCHFSDLFSCLVTIHDRHMQVKENVT